MFTEGRAMTTLTWDRVWRSNGINLAVFVIMGIGYLGITSSRQLRTALLEDGQFKFCRAAVLPIVNQSRKGRRSYVQRN